MVYSAANTHAEWAASSWTDSGTDEYEPTKQSEDGCRDEQIEAWDRERQWAATTAELDNHRHRADATETADSSASARAYSSDIASLARSEVEPTIPKPFEIRRPTEEELGLLAIPPPCVAAQRQMKTKPG